SRNEDNARTLANRLKTAWTTHIHKISQEADIYLFAIKDDVLEEVIWQVPGNQGLWVHTSGFLPMDIFKGYSERYGVMYPLQTFTKERALDLRHVPIFIEACMPEDEELLTEFALQLSSNVQILDSEKRKYLHVAAVFACNFCNHLYAIAYQILEENKISPNVLLPLIEETANKVRTLHPLKAQTGPAVRNDLEMINRHIALLTDPELKTIYQTISNHILKGTKP
ncbi:MAG: DUF2520 domain-containing protein, partial [Tannerella sp.]|nr:DUF2520 domain-containing protein [Tannerella sp.]